MLLRTRFAIASDLHIGPGARTDDLRPGRTLSTAPDTYLGQFKKFVSETDVRADYLIIPGDVTSQGAPDEFRFADAIIRQMAKILKVSRERILVIPGNHDLNWPVVKLDKGSPDFWTERRFSAFHKQRLIFDSLMREGREQHLCKSPWYLVREFENALVVAYNSAAFDLPGREPHRGAILQEAIDALDNELTMITPSPRTTRLFLVHHHPFQYSSVDPDYPDFSIMVNAGNLLTLLTKHRFDLLVHGHKHVPMFNIYSQDMSHPIGMFCAGSFSVRLDPNYNGVVANQFHLIDIEGRDETSGHVFGKVSSWAYLVSHGWVRSRRSGHGISHITPFGRYGDRDVIENEVDQLVQAALAAATHVEWKELCRTLPHLSYVPELTMLHIVRSIATKRGLRLHGDNADELLLLK